jgi:hypothetical protein
MKNANGWTNKEVTIGHLAHGETLIKLHITNDRLQTDLGINTGLQLSTCDKTCREAASSSRWHGVLYSTMVNCLQRSEYDTMLSKINFVQSNMYLSIAYFLSKTAEEIHFTHVHTHSLYVFPLHMIKSLFWFVTWTFLTVPGGEQTLTPHSLLQHRCIPGQSWSVLQFGRSSWPIHSPPRLFKLAGHLPAFLTAIKIVNILYHSNIPSKEAHKRHIIYCIHRKIYIFMKKRRGETRCRSDGGHH